MSVCFFIILSQIYKAVVEVPIKWKFWCNAKNFRELIRRDMLLDDKLILLSRILIEMDRNTFCHNVTFQQYINWCHRTGQLNEIEYSKLIRHFVLARNM